MTKKIHPFVCAPVSSVSSPGCSSAWASTNMAPAGNNTSTSDGLKVQTGQTMGRLRNCKSFNRMAQMRSQLTWQQVCRKLRNSFLQPFQNSKTTSSYRPDDESSLPPCRIVRVDSAHSYKKMRVAHLPRDLRSSRAPPTLTPTTTSSDVSTEEKEKHPENLASDCRDLVLWQPDLTGDERAVERIAATLNLPANTTTHAITRAMKLGFITSACNPVELAPRHHTAIALPTHFTILSNNTSCTAPSYAISEDTLSIFNSFATSIILAPRLLPKVQIREIQALHTSHGGLLVGIASDSTTMIKGHIQSNPISAVEGTVIGYCNMRKTRSTPRAVTCLSVSDCVDHASQNVTMVVYKPPTNVQKPLPVTNRTLALIPIYGVEVVSSAPSTLTIRARYLHGFE